MNRSKIKKWLGLEQETFKSLAEKYFESERYLRLAEDTKNNYYFSLKILLKTQSSKNKSMADIPIKKWNPFLVQRLIDKIGKENGATAAKHLRAFIRLIFNWGLNRGYCHSNPAAGRLDMPKERKKQTLPGDHAYNVLLEHAKESANYKIHTKGSCPYYIPLIMELAYLPRTRGVEIRNMTDAHILEEGFYVSRKKGSNDNITKWNGRLRGVIKEAQDQRNKIWDKRGMLTPIKPEDRPLIVNIYGKKLTYRAYQSAWGRFIRTAIEKNIISKEERFSPHDLKRKGITDTQGNKAEKQEASGHKNERMLEIYDKSIPRVNAASD